MSLTKNDLQAIRGIVENVVEDAKRQTAAGFAEVHKKFEKIDHKLEKVSLKLDTLQGSVNRIELIQKAEIERDDRQDKVIHKIRKTLKAI